MSDDLRNAIRALHDETRDAPVDDEMTRARIAARLRGTQRRKRLVTRWMLPIAAVLALSSAWAASRGAFDGSWRAATVPPRALVEPKGLASSNVPIAPASIAGTSTAPEETAPPPDVKATSPTAAASSAALGSAASSANVAAVAPIAPVASVATTEPIDGAADSDAALALYRRAHTLHFATRDPHAALDAWDAYLAAAPGGSFSLEARYNRALCLVRLGRKSEAKTALEPFANGVEHGYRQSEARALIDSLGRE